MLEGLTVSDLLPTIVAITGVLTVMWLILWLSNRAIRRLADRMEEERRERVEEIERWAAQLSRFVRGSVAGVAGVAALFIVLRGVGIRGVPELTWEQVAGWLVGPGMRILFVLVGAFIISRILHLFLERLPTMMISEEGPLAEVTERKKRATTVTRMLRMVTTIVVMSIAVLIVLRELGVDITPILTGSAIAGLAVGFGAQNVVRDVIGGFFLIIEDQVRMGDIAVINGKGGFVEAIRLRTIVLRGFDGTVHIFPNGEIHELSNMTKDFSYYVIDLGVAYKEDVDVVMGTLREVGQDLQADPAFARFILEPLEVVGVDAFADSAVIVKMRIKTVPLKQWVVGRELRRRIKKAFDERGIEIPYPHRSLYFGEASKPIAVYVTDPTAESRSGGEGDS